MAQKIARFRIPAMSGSHATLMPADADVFKIAKEQDGPELALFATVNLYPSKEGVADHTGAATERVFFLAETNDVLPGDRFDRVYWIKRYIDSVQDTKGTWLHIWEIRQRTADSHFA